MFRQACKGRDCIEIKAPHPGRIVGRVFREPGGKRCFKYFPEMTKCGENPVKT